MPKNCFILLCTRKLDLVKESTSGWLLDIFDNRWTCCRWKFNFVDCSLLEITCQYMLVFTYFSAMKRLWCRWTQLLCSLVNERTCYCSSIRYFLYLPKSLRGAMFQDLPSGAQQIFMKISWEPRFTGTNRCLDRLQPFYA